MHLLPPVNEHGSFRYPDGCAIWPTGRGKWRAKWADGTMLTGDNDKVYYFASPDEAAQALAEGGEGPAGWR